MDVSKMSVQNCFKDKKVELKSPLENLFKSVSKSPFKIPSQIPTDVQIRVSSRICERKRRALEKSVVEALKSEAAALFASKEKSAKQREQAAKEDIVTEDSESSSEFEEGTTGDDDSETGSQAGGPRHDVHIEIGKTLKKVLEQDHDLINNKSKLPVLPAQPTVISILESWVLHYTTTLLNEMPDKRQRNSKVPSILNKTIDDINLCREMADGIRVYFDHTLAGLLLYGVEREQNEMSMKAKVPPVPEIPQESIMIKDEIMEPDITIKEEVLEREYLHVPPFQKKEKDEDKEAEAEKASAITSTKRKLRSSRLSSAEESKPSKPVEEIKQETGNVSSLNSLASTSSRCSSPRGITLRQSAPPINSAQANELLDKAKKWRLVKEDQDRSTMPSNTYGAIHLARLFVRLPDLLQKAPLTDAQLKVTLKYIDMFLSFLEMHVEWFGEQFYTLKTSFEESNANQ